ncbi:transposase [Streptomyces sp. GSL17-111]|uniref:transposase n=1 Tax=Streptomyces sp. GSL17-111 TaxID=3121596 RepID=UPI0040406FC0
MGKPRWTWSNGAFPRGTAAGFPDAGPYPVGCRETGSKQHLICDGRGTPLKVIITAANVNDVTLTLVLVDGIPPGGRLDLHDALVCLACSLICWRMTQENGGRLSWRSSLWPVGHSHAATG